MITAAFAGPLAMLIALLGLRVSLKRIRSRIAPSNLEDPVFVRMQRAHGNACEHTPLLLVLLLLVELQGVARAVVIVAGTAILVARLMHAVGMTTRLRHPLHFYGAASTYTLEVLLGGLAAFRAAQQLLA